MPTEFQPILNRAGVRGTVTVQAEQTLAHTDFSLDLAKKHRFIRGVVGWVDLKDAELPEVLERYQDDPMLVGFRHVLQSEAAGFMLDKKFIRGVRQLAETGHTYDLLIYWHQMGELVQMVDRLDPDQPLVLDHLGKPNILDGRILKWKDHIKALVARPNTYCKISGMVTEAHWQYWTYEDLKPYIDIVFAAFGVDRCMFGSDWPVCLCLQININLY